MKHNIFVVYKIAVHLHYDPHYHAIMHVTILLQIYSLLHKSVRVRLQTTPNVFLLFAIHHIHTFYAHAHTRIVQRTLL